MRASLQPGNARKAASVSPIFGCSAIAGGSRSLGCSDSHAISADSLNLSKRRRGHRLDGLAHIHRIECREHVLCRGGDAGIDQHGMQRRQCQRLREHLANAAHDPRQGIKTDRHIGADCGSNGMQPCIMQREFIQPRQKTQGRRRVRRAAAETRRCGKIFGEFEMPQRETGHILCEQMRRFGDEVFFNWPALHDKGSLDRERQGRRRRQPQRVAFAREHDKAFDVVIAVRPPATDAQRQVDLGRRNLSRYAARWPQSQIILNACPAALAPVSRRFRISCWSCRPWSRSLRSGRRGAFPRSSSTRPARA